MHEHFDFATPTRILFGPGTLKQLGALAKEFGAHALVVTGNNPRRADPALALLRESKIQSAVYSISGEPSLQTITKGVNLAKTQSCDFVIACGGGSVIDAGKAIAAMLTNPGELLDYVEIIGRGKTLEKPSAPFIAIPTTAGTGSEVTRNSVLSSPDHGLKVSLRSPLMLPRIAIVDPELTLRLPPAITASTGLDALTQLIEPFVSTRANPMTDIWCVEGLNRVALSLWTAYHHGILVARTDMSFAATLSGLCLANAGLGAVHGLAGPIGGKFPAPHGAICAVLLPHVMQTNFAALQQRAPESPALPRYDQIARLLTKNPDTTADDGIQWVSQLVQELRIPSLRTYGIKQTDAPDLAEKAKNASSMKANPIALTTDELISIIHRAL